MANSLCLTITFLDRRFHGRRDAGEREWPPSPLRLFQAIVAASAARNGRIDHIADALQWFERLSPPIIVTPAGRPGQPYRLSVPNNAMDLVARAWSKGNYDGSGDANPATHRTMKTIRATYLIDGDQVHYLWELPASMSQEDRRLADSIRAAVRSVVALGWGIDLVVGHGQFVSIEQADVLAGERWLPDGGGSRVTLRVPAPGTLENLTRRHRAFLARIGRDHARNEYFNPVPPLAVFSTIGYRRTTDPLRRPFRAFSILNSDATASRPFDTPRFTAKVAGMVRHALARAAAQAGWATDRINEVIHGHTPDGRSPAQADPRRPRFSYVPLPSIHKYVRNGAACEQMGDIRRVLVAGNFAPEMQALIEWSGHALSGMDLVEEGGARCAILKPIPTEEWTVDRYAGTSYAWATVTPIVLDRHPKQRKRAAAEVQIRNTIAEACARAGLPSPVAIQISPVASLPGVAHARAFEPLRRKDGSSPAQTHATIVFDSHVSGPLLLGAGRYRGYGLCKPLNDGKAT